MSYQVCFVFSQKDNVSDVDLMVFFIVYEGKLN